MMQISNTLFSRALIDAAARAIPMEQVVADQIQAVHVNAYYGPTHAVRGVSLEFAANRIKQSLTGHGHASKQQMQRAIQGVWNLKSIPEPPDVADALAVALCCGRAEAISSSKKR